MKIQLIEADEAEEKEERYSSLSASSPAPNQSIEDEVKQFFDALREVNSITSGPDWDLGITPKLNPTLSPYNLGDESPIEKLADANIVALDDETDLYHARSVSPNEIIAKLERIAAVDMRRSGMSYDKIALAMKKKAMESLRQLKETNVPGAKLSSLAQEYQEKYTIQYIRKLVLEALEEMQTYALETVDEIRQIEAQRLDELTHALWPRAIKGDVKAITAILKIMKRRAELLGIDEYSALNQLNDSLSSLSPKINYQVVQNVFANPENIAAQQRLTEQYANASVRIGPIIDPELTGDVDS